MSLSVNLAEEGAYRHSLELVESASSLEEATERLRQVLVGIERDQDYDPDDDDDAFVESEED